MSYQFRCNTCNRVFTSNSRSAVCDRHGYYDRSASFIGEVVETAADVAVAVAVAHVTGDILGGVGDALGSIFDW